MPSCPAGFGLSSREPAPGAEARLSAGEAAYQQGAQGAGGGAKQSCRTERKSSAAEKKLKKPRPPMPGARLNWRLRKKELAAAKTNGKKQLDAAEKELAAAEEEICRGPEGTEKGRAEGQEKIAEGESRLADAQAQLEELAEPKWYTMTREDNPGYGEYTDAADRMNAMASVPDPLLFHRCLCSPPNTMTRMVDEQRTLIGTYKDWVGGRPLPENICSMPALPAFWGSAAGVAIGNVVLPRVVFGAYSIMCYPAAPADRVLSRNRGDVGGAGRAHHDAGRPFRLRRELAGALAADAARPPNPASGSGWSMWDLSESSSSPGRLRPAIFSAIKNGF